MADKLTYNAEEVAVILNIKVKTLYNRMSANDDLPPARKFGKKLIWLHEDVINWLEELPLAA